MEITESSLTDATVTFLLVLLAVCILFLPIDAFGEEIANHRVEPGMRDNDSSANALVIYFFRTGNTEAIALEIANRYQADLKNIKADDYSDDFTGSIKANIDAFQKLVEEKGGNFLDHIYVRRGRVYDQIGGNELIRQFRKLLEDRESKWIEVLR